MARARTKVRAPLPTFRRLVGPLFLSAFAKTTVSRDRRVYEEFRALAKSLGSQRKAAAACLEKWAHKCPTTKVGYVKSLAKMAKHYGRSCIRLPRNWSFLAIRSAKLAAAPHKPKRAQVLTSQNLRAMLLNKLISRRTRLLALLTFLSASRFDDLSRKTTKVQVLTSSIIRIALPVDKGNPFGRQAHKYVFAKPLIARFHLRRGTIKLNTPYTHFLRATKSISRSWTGHSGRRTATTTLSRKGFNLREIQALTLHSGLEARSLHSTRQYVQTSRRTPESKAQIRMSQALAQWAQL